MTGKESADCADEDLAPQTGLWGPDVDRDHTPTPQWTCRRTQNSLPFRGLGRREEQLSSKRRLPAPTLAPQSSSCGALFFLVAQWLNNFKCSMLCTQHQLLKLSWELKAVLPRSFFHTMGN